MNYQPAVTDRSAEIYSNAANTAAEINFRGMQSLGNSLSALGQNFSNSIDKAKENAAKADTNAGTAEAIDSILGVYGSPEQRKTFHDGLEKVSGNQDKTSGYLAMHVPVANALVELNKSTQIANVYGHNNAVLATRKAAATAAAKAAQPDKMNAETIRSYASNAAQQGASPDQIKAALLRGYGQWAVDAVYPQPKQNFWGP